MHHRGLTTVLFLATIVLIAGLLTGCGDQSGSGSQQDGASKAEQGKNAPVGQGENVPKKQGKNAPKKKILFGTVTFVNTKTEGFSVRPTIDEQGNKPVAFRLANESSISLGGKKRAASSALTVPTLPGSTGRGWRSSTGTQPERRISTGRSGTWTPSCTSPESSTLPPSYGRPAGLASNGFSSSAARARTRPTTSVPVRSSGWRNSCVGALSHGRYFDLVKSAAAALGRSPPIVRLPIEPVRLALAAAERLRLPLPVDSGQLMRLREDKAYPYDRAWRDLDYTPRPFREGVGLEVARLRRLGMVRS